MGIAMRDTSDDHRGLKQPFHARDSHQFLEVEFLASRFAGTKLTSAAAYLSPEATRDLLRRARAPTPFTFPERRRARR